jgi:hypothetical protein
MKNHDFMINNKRYKFLTAEDQPKVFHLTRGDLFKRLSARTQYEKEIEIFKVTTERCRISVSPVFDKKHPMGGYVNIDIETGQMRKAFADGDNNS